MAARVLECFLARLQSPRCYHERKANSPYASAKVRRPDCLSRKQKGEKMIKRPNKHLDTGIENDHHPQSCKNCLTLQNKNNMISQQQHGQFCGQEQHAKSNKTRRKANTPSRATHGFNMAQRTKIQAFSDVLLISSL